MPHLGGVAAAAHGPALGADGRPVDGERPGAVPRADEPGTAGAEPLVHPVAAGAAAVDTAPVRIWPHDGPPYVSVSVCPGSRALSGCDHNATTAYVTPACDVRS